MKNRRRFITPSKSGASFRVSLQATNCRLSFLRTTRAACEKENYANFRLKGGEIGNLFFTRASALVPGGFAAPLAPHGCLDLPLNSKEKITDYSQSSQLANLFIYCWDPSIMFQSFWPLSVHVHPIKHFYRSWNIVSDAEGLNKMKGQVRVHFPRSGHSAVKT